MMVARPLVMISTPAQTTSHVVAVVGLWDYQAPNALAGWQTPDDDVIHGIRQEIERRCADEFGVGPLAC